MKKPYYITVCLFFLAVYMHATPEKQQRAIQVMQEALHGYMPPSMLKLAKILGSFDELSARNMTPQIIYVHGPEQSGKMTALGNCLAALELTFRMTTAQDILTRADNKLKKEQNEQARILRSFRTFLNSKGTDSDGWTIRVVKRYQNLFGRSGEGILAHGIRETILNWTRGNSRRVFITLDIIDADASDLGFFHRRLELPLPKPSDYPVIMRTILGEAADSISDTDLSFPVPISPHHLYLILQAAQQIAIVDKAPLSSAHVRDAIRELTQQHDNSDDLLFYVS